MRDDLKIMEMGCLELYIYNIKASHKIIVYFARTQNFKEIPNASMSS